MNAKAAGTYSNQCVLNDWLSKMTTFFITVSVDNFESSCRSVQHFIHFAEDPPLLINILFVTASNANKLQFAAFQNISQYYKFPVTWELPDLEANFFKF